MIDIGLLKIDGAVFHQVPTQASGADPVLSTAESALDGQLELFLRDRLTRTFGRAAQRVERDPDVDVPTPDLVIEALNDGSNAAIVQRFHPMPALLLAVQAHNSPEGLLSVIRGSCGPTRVVVLVKVEQERGLSFQTIDHDGELRVEVVIEDGLVFTDKTDVFKAALFYLDDDDELAGLLTDDQTGSMYRGPASVYWLSDFLGCRYLVGPDVLTRAWIKATERLVKSDLDDPADKSAVLSAMYVELRSNRRAIDPIRFIDDNVPDSAQDAARQRLLNAGASTTRFNKSSKVSDSAPLKKRFEFDTGVQVTMPADATPELTKEEIDGDELDVLTIRGHIRHVHS